MRKQFFIPVLVGMLAFGAAQAFAQSATVVMRNGERVQAEVRDMGRDFTFRVNGQPRAVPIGDVVLIDFAGDGRNISADELSRGERGERGYVVMRNGETVQRVAAGLHGQTRSSRSSRTDARRTSATSRAFISVRSATSPVSRVASAVQPDAERPAARGEAAIGRVSDRSPRRQTPARWSCRRTSQWTNTGFNVSRGQIAALRAVRRDSSEHQRRRHRAASGRDERPPAPTAPRFRRFPSARSSAASATVSRSRSATRRTRSTCPTTAGCSSASTTITSRTTAATTSSGSGSRNARFCSSKRPGLRAEGSLCSRPFLLCPLPSPSALRSGHCSTIPSECPTGKTRSIFPAPSSR